MKAILVFRPTVVPGKNVDLPNSSNRVELMNWNQHHQDQVSRDCLLRVLAECGLRLPTEKEFLRLQATSTSKIPDGFYPLYDKPFQFGMLDGSVVYADAMFGKAHRSKPIAVVGVAVDKSSEKSI